MPINCGTKICKEIKENEKQRKPCAWHPLTCTSCNEKNIKLSFEDFSKNLIHDIWPTMHVRTFISFKPNGKGHGHFYIIVYDNATKFWQMGTSLQGKQCLQWEFKN